MREGRTDRLTNWRHAT